MDSSSTLAEEKNSDSMYRDRDSLPFEATYPIIEFQSEIITANDDQKKLEKHLVNNFWYQKANSKKRQQILSRVANVNKNIKIILDLFDKTYKHLDLECIHISLAGSYLYAVEPGDIDLDVVVKGSFFDYSTFNEGVDILDTTGYVRKVSLTVMGADNISGKRKISDNIENKGFMHQDTILREMLVAPMRNATVYGKTFDYSKSVDSRNVLVRIARQLYFSILTLEGKIPYYNEDPLKTKKALSRIREAHEIIEWLLNSEDATKNS